MKTANTIVLTGLLTLVSLNAQLTEPTGFIKANESNVREGSSVNLSWEVDIPAEKIDDLIEIDPDGDITPKENVAFYVRVLGAEYAWASNYARIGAWYTTGDSWWLNYFWGYGDDQSSLSRNTCDILYTGEPLKFMFRGSKNGFREVPPALTKWHKDRFSGTVPDWAAETNPAIILKDGDPLPQFAIPEGQLGVASFLGPYLDSTGKYVDIGPLDIIILADLDKNRDEPNADYQDMVVLVTFSKADDSSCTRRWTGPPKPTEPTKPADPAQPKPEPPVYPELPVFGEPA